MDDRKFRFYVSELILVASSSSFYSVMSRYRRCFHRPSSSSALYQTLNELKKVQLMSPFDVYVSMWYFKMRFKMNYWKHVSACFVNTFWKCPCYYNVALALNKTITIQQITSVWVFQSCDYSIWPSLLSVLPTVFTLCSSHCETFPLSCLYSLYYFVMCVCFTSSSCLQGSPQGFGGVPTLGRDGADSRGVCRGSGRPHPAAGGRHHHH